MRAGDWSRKGSETSRQGSERASKSLRKARERRRKARTCDAVRQVLTPWAWPAAEAQGRRRSTPSGSTVESRQKSDHTCQEALLAHFQLERFFLSQRVQLCAALYRSAWPVLRWRPCGDLDSAGLHVNTVRSQNRDLMVRFHISRIWSVLGSVSRQGQAGQLIVTACLLSSPLPPVTPSWPLVSLSPPSPCAAPLHSLSRCVCGSSHLFTASVLCTGFRRPRFHDLTPGRAPSPPTPCHHDHTPGVASTAHVQPYRVFCEK